MHLVRNVNARRWSGTALVALAVTGTLTPVSASQTLTRTTYQVTDQGVFAVEDAVNVPPPPSTGNPDPSSPGTVWTYNDPPGLPWISEDVALGNDGTFAWMAQNLNGERLSFAATTADAGTFAPIYEDDLLGALELNVAAADKAPIAAIAHRSTNTGPHDLRVYTGFTATPATQAVPVSASASGFFKIAMSGDGERVSVGYTEPGGLPAVQVFDTVGGSAIVSNTTFIGPASTYRQHAFSGDGNRVLLGSQTDNYLYEVGTGLLFSDSSTVSHDAHAIDQDGDTWGRGGFDVGVWKFGGAGWSRILTFNDATLGFGVFTAVGFSSDGSTFVAAAYDATDNDELRIHCFQIGASSATLLWSYSSSGTGGKQDVPTGVALSDDGKYIAVSSYGDGAAAHPEVLLFDRDLGSAPIAGLDTVGSAFSVDLSGDGRFLLAGFKDTHANDFGNGGQVISYRVGGEGHWLSGTPSIGQNVALHNGGAVGDQLLIAASLALLPSPVPVPGFRGGFALDPSLLVVPPTPVLVMPVTQVALPFTLPNNPAIIGLTFFTQTIRLGSNTLDNAVKIPITP